MKITKIEAQVKQKGRYSVYVDDKFEFGISELGLINSGLKVGKECSSQELENLKETARTDKIYNQTLNLIARRPRSQWEVEDYLRRKEVNEPIGKEIIEKLKERKYIDDRNFARQWIENRRLRGSISKRKLKAELRVKRISDTIASEVLKEDKTDEYEVIVAEIEKKRRQSRYQDDKKLMAYLARQGYSYDIIKRGLSGDAG